MTDLTLANIQFSESQVFWHEDHQRYFYIDVVKNAQPHDIIFCLYFNFEEKKQLVDIDPKRFCVSVLSKALWDGKAKLIDPTAALSEPISPTSKQQKIIDMWEEFISVLKHGNQQTLPRADKRVSKAIAKMNWAKYDYKVPSLSNCQEKIKRYDEAQSNPLALCPFGYHAMKGASRIAPATEDLLLSYIDNRYLVDLPAHSVNPAEIFRDFREEFELLQAKSPDRYPKLPCKETFYKRLRALDKVVVALHRLNDKEKQKLRKLRKTEFIVDRVLERVEFDAVHLAIGIIKYEGTGTNRERVYRGRVVLMLAIDVFSRAIIGYSYHIAKSPGETADLAVQCFKSVVMPKNPKRNWPMHGKPAKVVSDGSTAATGDQFHNIVTSTGAIHITTQANQPWKKPFIERFMLTLRTQWASKFDTYLGSKLFRNHDHLNNDDKVEKVVMQEGKKHKGKRHKSKKHCMTEEEFVDNFERYIADTYHQSPHGGLNGYTPLEVWNNSVADEPMRWTTLPNHHPVFTRMGLSADMRNIHPDGCIRVNNALYACEKLKELVGTVSKIHVYYSDIDADSIAFEHGGTWHRAALCPANYTPTDTSQRAELDRARTNSHGPRKDKHEKKNFHPTGIESFEAQPKDDEKDTSKAKPKPTDIDADDAKDKLKEAEDASLEYAPPKVQQMLKDNNAQSQTTDAETDLNMQKQPRRRKIGIKL
jgi:transposase InsO family protein